MSGNVNILNLEKFKQCVLFSITIRRWGNRAQIKDLAALQKYIEQMKAESGTDNGENKGPTVVLAGDRVKSTKVLIKSAAYDEVCRELGSIKAWCLSRSMPSFFKSGMFVVKQDEVKNIEAYIRTAVGKLTEPDGKLTKFLEVYPTDVQGAKDKPVKQGGLGPLFRQNDYPSPDEIAKMFSVDWYWLTMSVPENIPDELKQEANEKFARRMADAAAEIENALRVEFKDLLSHAEERLTQKPGDEPKIFKNSMLGNIAEFIQTFNSKNVFVDEQLASLVDEAKKVLLNDDGSLKVEAQKLREYANVRETTKAAFTSIKEKLDTLIEDQGRAFNFQED